MSISKNMICSILSLCFLNLCGQNTINFSTPKKNITIPFELVNNLIVLPVAINGVKMHFILDTGVEQCILFSTADMDSLALNDIKKIKLRGLGNNESIDALQSDNNKITIANCISEKQTVIVVLEQDLNISTSLGITVNGILGYTFFKDNFIEINYIKRKIKIYSGKKINSRKLAKYNSYPITIERNKPYLTSLIGIEDTSTESKFLLDTGSSDAVWFFQSASSNNIKVPDISFYDFLGRGLSGEIYGKRARIQELNINNIKFKNPIVAFPDSNYTSQLNLLDNRLGSVGSEIFKRFDVIFDYKNQMLYLKKNSNFDLPFEYNMSGIELEHVGFKYVIKSSSKTVKLNFGGDRFDFQYSFELKPVYKIIILRKDSPAELAGLKKNDIVEKINNVSCYNYSLQEINSILKEQDGKEIKVKISRNDEEIYFKFRLKSLL